MMSSIFRKALTPDNILIDDFFCKDEGSAFMICHARRQGRNYDCDWNLLIRLIQMIRFKTGAIPGNIVVPYMDLNLSETHKQIINYIKNSD